MSVKVDGENVQREYSAIFNTTSLPCLRRMTMGPGLRPRQHAAINSVHYDASKNIAIKFKTPWLKHFCQIEGGQATTDLPIRTCVYPSSESRMEQNSSFLLCSYTWGQDVQQMASLVKVNPHTDQASQESLKQGSPEVWGYPKVIERSSPRTKCND